MVFDFLNQFSFSLSHTHTRTKSFKLKNYLHSLKKKEEKIDNNRYLSFIKLNTERKKYIYTNNNNFLLLF